MLTSCASENQVSHPSDSVIISLLLKCYIHEPVFFFFFLFFFFIPPTQKKKKAKKHEHLYEFFTIIYVMKAVNLWSVHQKSSIYLKKWLFVWFPLKSSGDKYRSIDLVRNPVWKKVLSIFLIYLLAFWTKILMILLFFLRQIHLEKY